MRSTWPRTAGRFGALLERLGYQAPPYATARSVARGAAARRGRRLPAARAPLLRARRPRDGDRLLARGPRRLPAPARPRGAKPAAARSSSTASSRTPSRWTSTRSATASDGVDRRDHAARRGGRRALRRLRLRAAAALARRGDARADPRRHARASRSALGVVGLLNVQYAVHDGELYVIEANPRASRTVPFVSKAVGLPLAKLACRDHARRAHRRRSACRTAAKGSASASTSRSRRPCCRSTASRAPTRCSAPRCAPPAR